MTTFEDRVLQKVKKRKCGHRGGLSATGLVFQETGKSGHMCTRWGDDVRVQGNGGHLQAQGEMPGADSSLAVVRRNQPCRSTDLELPAYGTVRKYVCCLSRLDIVHCYGNPGKATRREGTLNGQLEADISADRGCFYCWEYNGALFLSSAEGVLACSPSSFSMVEVFNEGGTLFWKPGWKTVDNFIQRRLLQQMHRKTNSMG